MVSMEMPQEGGTLNNLIARFFVLWFVLIVSGCSTTNEIIVVEPQQCVEHTLDSKSRQNR